MSNRAFSFALIAIAGVVLLGMGLDVMEVDAAQYAGMSRDMVVRGDLLKLYFRGEDYLDKPPMLFWATTLSFKIFGVHDWSYRLPSILFAFLGLYATYRFTLLYHSAEVARLAVVIFGGSAAFLLMTNDVRCDTILTGAVITAVWLGCSWLELGGTLRLVGCALMIGTAMLTKGPIGAVAPMVAIGAQLMLTRRWSRLRDARLLLVPVIIALVLLPMCIGLYEQHGMHGIRFYFWEQSFGRITGENRWKDDSSVFFFTHEVLWQLLPWTIFLLLGLANDIRSLVRRDGLPEYASLVGAILVFVAISLSQFKLPHYLYVTIPLFAVVTARAVHGTMSNAILKAHIAVLILLWTAGLFLVVVVFPEGRWPFVALFVFALILALMLFRRKGLTGSTASLSVVLMVAIGLAMNGHFYPNLLQYQANAKAGQWAARNELGQQQFFALQLSGTALDLYAGFPVVWLSDAAEAERVVEPGVVIYTDAEHRSELLSAGLVPTSEVVLPNYPVQVLGLSFLFPEQRAATLEERFLLRY